MSQYPQKTPVILLVDDSPDDLLLIRKAFERARMPNALLAVSSGQEAIDYFQGRAVLPEPATHPVPDLLLLDIAMPGVDGFGVLTWVRSHPALKTLPIIMLASSSLEKDVAKAYDLGANAFLVKPVKFDELVDSLKSLVEYWCAFSRAPQRPRTI